MSWNTHSMPDLTGRVVVITGGNSGIGLEAARQFVRAGAEVVLACRDQAKGEQARNAIGGRAGQARVTPLDLADLDSVASAAKRLADEHQKIDVLVANAAIMGGRRLDTAQGHERQMGTNHLGHFALVAQLWSSVLAAAGRVVVVSSIASRGGRLTAGITERDLADPVPYVPQKIYANTKQANLLFAQELHRRTTAVGQPVRVIACHPGVSWTNLFPRQLADEGRGWLVPVARILGPVVLQSGAAGALPTLRASVDPEIPGGAFVGPSLLGQTRGAPKVVDVFPQGRDVATAQRLWQLSESLTGVPFPV